MVTQLTDVQLRELDQPSTAAVTLEDPRNGALYVLIPHADFLRVRLFLSQPSDVGTIDESSESLNRRAMLIHALRQRTPEMEKRLFDMKQAGAELAKRTDLVWYLLLESASTLGNSRGYAGLFGNQPLLDSVSYAALVPLASKARRKRILTALQTAKVRMPKLKSIWLTDNFARIEKMGGVERATQMALALHSRQSKLEFMMAFHGIGPKYGRNIWMGLYDPDFRDAIAVDQRIINVTTALGCSFKRYPDYEAFYREVASEVGLEPWEVDRLLYWFTDHFIAAIA
jgi:hypothetical protein